MFVGCTSWKNETETEIGIRLAKEMQRLAKDPELLNEMGIPDILSEKIGEFAHHEYDAPLSVSRFTFTEESFIEYKQKFSENKALIAMAKRNVPLQAAADYGSDWVLAANLLSRNYSMLAPSDFSRDCFLLLAYENYFVYVIFLEGEDRTVLTGTGFFPNEGFDENSYEKDFAALFPAQLALKTEVIFRR